MAVTEKQIKESIKKITPKVKKVVKQVIRVAIEYEKITGRKLGITGEIGEVLVCEKLKLKLLSSPIATGFDAVDSHEKKYQIKTRRGNVNSPGARIGKFSKYKFDYAVLAILDDDYSIKKLYKTTFRRINPIIEATPRRNPSLRKFKNNADEIFVK